MATVKTQQQQKTPPSAIDSEATVRRKPNTSANGSPRSPTHPPLYYASANTEDSLELPDSRRISWDALFPSRNRPNQATSSSDRLGELREGEPNGMSRPNTSPANLYDRQGSWQKDDEAMSFRSTSSASSVSSSSSVSVVKKPLRPPKIPFLPTDLDDKTKGCTIRVDDTSSSQYQVVCHLPGFNPEHITVALKRNGSLHVLANRWADTTSKSEAKDDTSVHYERMVELGRDAIGGQAKANWTNDGNLTVTITRKPKKEPVVRDYD